MYVNLRPTMHEQLNVNISQYFKLSVPNVYVPFLIPEQQINGNYSQTLNNYW